MSEHPSKQLTKEELEYILKNPYVEPQMWYQKIIGETMKTPLEEMKDRIELQRLEDQYDLNKKLSKQATEILNKFLFLLDKLSEDEEFIEMMNEDFEFWENMIDARNENKEE